MVGLELAYPLIIRPLAMSGFLYLGGSDEEQAIYLEQIIRIFQEANPGCR